MTITTTHPDPDLPRPAGTEAYELEWRHSEGGETHFRRFESKKFPVFDGLTVRTGGMQCVQDNVTTLNPEFIIREIRIVSTWTCGMLEDQARKLCDVIIEAADYVAELESGDPHSEGTGSP